MKAESKLYNLPAKSLRDMGLDVKTCLRLFEYVISNDIQKYGESHFTKMLAKATTFGYEALPHLRQDTSTGGEA
jgi:hypothetical protein